jgi:hypothetical protein
LNQPDLGSGTYFLAVFVPSCACTFFGVSVATSGDVRDQPRVADAASELLQDVFGKERSPCRLVVGVASLPLGTPVELEVIFEVCRSRTSEAPSVR